MPTFANAPLQEALNPSPDQGGGIAGAPPFPEGIAGRFEEVNPRSFDIRKPPFVNSLIENRIAEQEQANPPVTPGAVDPRGNLFDPNEFLDQIIDGITSGNIDPEMARMLQKFITPEFIDALRRRGLNEEKINFLEQNKTSSGGKFPFDFGEINFDDDQTKERVIRFHGEDRLKKVLSGLVEKASPEMQIAKENKGLATAPV